MNKKNKKGKIKLTNSGIGFLQLTEEEVRIENENLNTALDGDLVEVIIVGKKDNQDLGKVVKIEERKRIQFVGTLQRKGENYCFLLPDDKKMYTDIFIPNTDESVPDGYKALVEIVSWKPNKKSPEGKIIKIIGKKGREEVVREAIVLENGMYIDFNDDIERQTTELEKKAEGMMKNEIKNRRDFRNIKTFTIDPETAKDFDDALSISKLSDDLFEIGVHIADVSFYIKENTPIDIEARKRGFSIYMVGETIPMLPEILSNDLCSLNPNEDKLAFSAIFKINKKGEVSDFWVGETVINSDKRYSYEQAMQEIEAGDYELSILNEIAKNLSEKRIKNGALKFNTDEIVFELDKGGKPIEISKKEVLETHGLIEEFMLLANKYVTEKWGGKPFLYRVHEKPDRNTLDELKGFLAKIGHKNDLEGNITSQDLNNLIDSIKGEPIEFLVNNVILRSMTKAYYSTKNKGHFGLAFTKYTHFTSPIRRYADLITHRIIKKKLKGKKLEDLNYYESIAITASENELKALDAERDSIAYKKCQYMLKKRGERRRAIISGITDWGIYVRDTKSYAEGMISLRSLNNDYYILDKETYSLIGRNTKKRYSLGDEISVLVEKVDLDARVIDFTLA